MEALRLLVSRDCAAAGATLAAQPGLAPLALAVELFDPPLKAWLKRQPPEGTALVLEPEGLALYALDLPGSGPVRVALEEGALAWRIGAERARHEAIVRACGLLKSPSPLTVFDATAGLLRDTCVLAAAGARVWLAERSPVIAALIEDGLRRAALQPDLQPLLERLTFLPGDAVVRLQSFADAADKPDVVYLDPMFPHRDKSALVKKEMRVFRAVVGEDTDADALLQPALAAARRRVVVKRPRGAPVLGGRPPALALEGKSARFDVYLVQGGASS